MTNSGVYQILNIIDNKMYIGSSINVSSRLKTHIYNLKNNKHCNKHLQSAWDKYGEENFIFEILERVCNKENLIEREQYWIDKLIPQYNIRLEAKSNLGLKASEKTRAKMRDSAKASGNRPPRMFGNKFNLGRKASIETIKKLINSHSKEYIFIDPNNVIHKIFNLKEFCLNNKLCLCSMYKVYSGNISYYKNWRKYESN